MDTSYSIISGVCCGCGELKRVELWPSLGAEGYLYYWQLYGMSTNIRTPRNEGFFSIEVMHW